jgi:hypothetical protein
MGNVQYDGCLVPAAVPECSGPRFVHSQPLKCRNPSTVQHTGAHGIAGFMCEWLILALEEDVPFRKIRLFIAGIWVWYKILVSNLARDICQ